MNHRAWTRNPPTDSSGVRMDVAARSHVGKVRKANEDHFLVARMARSFSTLFTNLPDDAVPSEASETGYGMLVADGVGGTAAGGLASRMAITSFVNLILDAPEWIARSHAADEEEFMSRATRYFQQVDRTLAKQIEMQPELAGMGTTMTMAYSFGRDLFVAHVGDSRAYLFRRGELHALTHDHNVAASRAATGENSDQTPLARRQGKLLTNTIGGKSGISVDVGRLRLNDADTVLLCTDGLTSMLPDEEIGELLERDDSAATNCDALIGRALARGGRDNVTVIVARYDIPAAASTSQQAGRWASPLANRPA